MGAALGFLGAIFFGAAAGSSLAYVLAVNLARIALLSLVSKALAPKIDLTQAAADKLLTVRSTFQPQSFVYGQDMLSGPLIFANTAGEGNKELHRLVALTGREIDEFLAFRIDDTDIVIGDDIASDSGPVIDGQFADVVEIDTRLGTQSQTAIADLLAAFPTNWTSAHAGLGWALLYTKMTLVDGNEAFEAGIPQNLRALVKGHKVYDPREGGHDVEDPSTWEWSDNPALCLADFLMWQRVGMGEVPERIDWDLVEAAADICDEQLVVPGDDSDGGLQNRYTCNFTFYGDQDRGSIVEILTTAMMGRLVFSQGQWRMWAGAPIAATVTLTEANLAGPITLQASTPSENRYNRVSGKFVDPSRNFTANPYPEIRDAAYETADNEIKYQTFDLNACNNTYEAQRNATIRLRQSRMQRVLTWSGNWSCFRVQPGTTVEIDVAELGFSGAKYFVTEWTLDKEGKGVNLTMVQEDDDVWDEPDEYIVRSSTGALIFESEPPPAEEFLANMVIVADGGTFRAAYSAEGITWTGRAATNITWQDVDYAQGAFVAVASSGAGNRIMRSEDGGVTWALATELSTGWRNYRRIMALPSGRLIVGTENHGGANPEENIISSDDAGVTWTRRNTTGMNLFRCDQFAYGDGVLVAGGAGGGADNIMQSTDDGNTWNGFYEMVPASSEPCEAIAYHPSLGFVGVGGFGSVNTSPDGITWTQIAAAGTIGGTANHLLYNPAFNKLYLGTSLAILSSSDGITWTTEDGVGTRKIIYSALTGRMLAVRVGSSDSAVVISSSGTYWQPSITPANSWDSIAVES